MWINRAEIKSSQKSVFSGVHGVSALQCGPGRAYPRPAAVILMGSVNIWTRDGQDCISG